MRGVILPPVVATCPAARAAALTLLWLGLGQPAAAAENRLLLFAGPEWRDFLGCVNCRASNPYSIWNPASDYGSPTHPLSIWNRSGNYGSTTGRGLPGQLPDSLYGGQYFIIRSFNRRHNVSPRET